jgi:uncharacterized protein YhbP (UPF0306 family)
MAERALLEAYIEKAKLMQLSTMNRDGTPSMCQVWYSCQFAPDALFFISRKDRVHSANIRERPHVAGAVVDIPLTGLGQKVRGVTFQGLASELGTDCEPELGNFISRWPKASEALTVSKLVSGETRTRLYSVRVTQWILFDERNFPESPRRVVSAKD